MSEKEKIYHVGNYKTDPTLIEWEKAHDKIGTELDEMTEKLKEEAKAFEAQANKTLKPLSAAVDASWDSIYDILKAKGVTADLNKYSAFVNRETGDVFVYDLGGSASGMPDDVMELIKLMKSKGATVSVEKIDAHTAECPSNPKNQDTTSH